MVSQFHSAVCGFRPRTLSTKAAKFVAMNNTGYSNRRKFVSALDGMAAPFFDSVQVAGPGFHDPDYHKVGVLCIGTIVASNQDNMRAKWLNKPAYSGSFANKQNEYWVKPQGAPLRQDKETPSFQTILSNSEGPLMDLFSQFTRSPVVRNASPVAEHASPHNLQTSELPQSSSPVEEARP